MSFGLSAQFIFIIIFVTLTVISLAYYAWFGLKKFYGKSFWSRMRKRGPAYLQAVLVLICLLFSFVFVSIAVTLPRWGEKVITTEKSGSDILFVLDVSKSMKALDMSLRNKMIDRLTAAKLLVSDMVKVHPENNYGLVVFAGDAFILSPITFDTASFVDILNSASTEDVMIQGTDLSKALSMSLARFDNSLDEDENDKGRAIVLISDGGEDESPALMPVLEEAKRLNVPIYTLGIGDSKGVPIPEGRDVFGDIVYKKHNGNIVYTKLNEAPLKFIAKETNGEYWHLKDGWHLNAVAKKLSGLKPHKTVEKTITGGEERYQGFLFSAFFFFVFFVLLSQIGVVTFVSQRNFLRKK